jgi:hypothetical protein
MEAVGMVEIDDAFAFEAARPTNHATRVATNPLLGFCRRSKKVVSLITTHSRSNVAINDTAITL